MQRRASAVCFFVGKASGEKGCKPTPPRTFLPRQSAGELAAMVLYRHFKREGTREVVGVLEREGREAVGAFRPRFLQKKKQLLFCKGKWSQAASMIFFFSGKNETPLSHFGSTSPHFFFLAHRFSLRGKVLISLDHALVPQRPDRLPVFALVQQARSFRPPRQRARVCRVCFDRNSF